MPDENIKPGETVSDSGQYQIVGPRGGNTGESEVTLIKGKTAPPTPKPGQTFKLVDLTKHKRK